MPASFFALFFGDSKKYVEDVFIYLDKTVRIY